MSLYSDLNEVLTPYAQRIKGLITSLGNLSNLETTDKSSIVAAINEAAQSGGTEIVIDDTLTQSGQAAGAAETGRQIGLLKADLAYVVSFNYTVGKNINVNMDIIDDVNACISDYIPLTWVSGTQLKIFYTDDAEDSNGYRIVFYDANKNKITEYIRNPMPLLSRTLNGTSQYVQNAAYFRLSFKKGFAGKVIVNGLNVYVAELTESMIYDIKNDIGILANLRTENKSNIVESINDVDRKIPNLPLEPSSTSFFYVSKNLVNPDKCVIDYIVNQTNGNRQSAAKHSCTDYIDVTPSTSYMMRFINSNPVDMRICFYTGAKRFISGDLYSVQTTPKIVTTPANAEYVMLSMTTKTPDKIMFSAYTDGDSTDFESFDHTHLLDKYIQKESLENVPLNLPPKIYALVGYETNIYFENLVEDWDKYNWDVTCSKGMQLERGYRITPESDDVGTYDLTITIGIDGLSKSAQANLVVTAAAAGNGVTKSVIILGDSTTYNGIAVSKINENFSNDVMSVVTLGTMGTSPNNHEGRSGWKWADYFTKASITYPSGDPRGIINNPFYNPTSETFDADYYFVNSGISKPDWFILNLGINDVFGYSSDSELAPILTTVLEYYATAVESILDATTTTKIGICVTIPPNHSQDAFGKAYKCGQTRNRYKRNNVLLAQALINTYSGRENERIYIIPIHAALDTVYNMGMEALPVNARNTDAAYQSPIGNGGVHPATSGYWQIADVYTAFLKANA